MRRSFQSAAVAIAVGMTLTSCAAASTASSPSTKAVKVTLSSKETRIAEATARLEAAGASPTHPGEPQPITPGRWPSYVSGVQAVADLTRAQAETYLDAKTDDETPVIVVRLTGHFTALHTGPAPATSSSQSNNLTSGTAIEVIVDENDGKILDFGIGSSAAMPPLPKAQPLFAATS